MTALRPLRPHQDRALIALRKSLVSGRKRPMLMAPTGAGKTLLAAHIIQSALGKGKRVAFTVPALSLIDQTVAAFQAEGIHAVGVMQGIHERTDGSQPVQICSVQTLARRKQPEVDLVIVDEAHQLHREIFKWMKDCPDLPFIGLSATPWARGLGKYYDDLIVAATTAGLIRDGYLSPFVVYAPSVPDLDGIRTIAGEFDQGQLAERVNKPTLVGDVVAEWLKRARDLPTLVYGVDRAHARHLQQRFVEAGVPAEYIDAYTERAERQEIFDRFTAGEVRVICNIGTLTTGIDLDVRCIIDAKPTKSEMLFVQTIGRGLRTAPGKDRLIVLDHAGNALRLGLVTNIQHDALDAGEQRKSVAVTAEKAKPLPRLCECCKALMPPQSMKCAECGTVREAKTAIVIADGELVELGSRQKSGAIVTSYNDKVAFYDELRGYALVRGYAPGWVAHKYHEKFHSWPDAWLKDRKPKPPSLKTSQWIRSRQIAFAKGRAHG
jgi:DNA repair protein RadD